MREKRISKDEKFQRTVGGISWVSCVTVSGLAMASFTLSFDALRSLAVEQEVVNENLSWIYPNGTNLRGIVVAFRVGKVR